MTAERTSLAPCLPSFGRALGLGRNHVLPPPIVAQRHELVDERLGRLSYYSNINERAVTVHKPGLVLVHDVHLGAGSHELRHLFESMRDARAVYALDLPGFGRSECRGKLGAELYVAAIERLVASAVRDTGGPVDIVAVALSAEFAAKVAARCPTLVHSLVLVAPTGFASDWERSAFESAARRGKALWRVALARRLGLSALLYQTFSSALSLRVARYCDGAALPQEELHYARAAAARPGAERAGLAFLAGALFPQENPQAIYTRVHCPTLVLTPRGSAERFGELERFVKWREHFTAQSLPALNLTTPIGSATVTTALSAFWARLNAANGLPDPDRHSDRGRDGAERT